MMLALSQQLAPWGGWWELLDQPVEHQHHLQTKSTELGAVEGMLVSNGN
jgi:hypothetical protein